MKINIVNYEEGKFNGILSKYAYKMQEELKKLKIPVTVSSSPSKKADINHHINYRSYIPSGKIDTLMVTHIWEGDKLDKLKEALKTSELGICFSNDTKTYLESQGLKKLTAILPAHDSLPRIKKVLIATNVYPDGCKREQMFYELLKNIDKSKWHFFIMGYGWNIDGLDANISYLDHFEAQDYPIILNNCEYSLYFGKDEGSMGILDSVNCGLKTIAPNVGFHKEIGIDYPFDTQEELNAVFKKLERNPVADLTWENYAKKHLKLWQKLYAER